MSHVHAVGVYILVGLTLATVLVLRGTPAMRHALVLLGVELLQGTIGFTQYFTDLPIALVAAHLVGAAVLMAAGARLVLAVQPAATSPRGSSPAEQPLPTPRSAGA